MNKWTGMGRLVHDTNVNFAANDKCVTRFVMACNYKSKDKQHTEFVQCEAWGKTAETIGEYCGTGDQILVEGRLHTRVYEKNGEKRFFTGIVVNRMEFGSKRNTLKQLPDSEREPVPEWTDEQEAIWDDSPDASPNDEVADEDIPF